ncbi:MAG: biopolymer transporter ExbD [Salinibacterium sp.]|nr:biopolymer transporter ExbD [Salinibacterium sp.]
MIDVVFMLLIYFLLSTTLSNPESDLASALRAQEESGQSSASDFQPQIVEVVMDRQGVVYRLGAREMRSAAALETLLTTLPKDPGVFVKVAPSVPVGAAAAGLQACKDAGFVRVSYVPMD